MHGTINIKSNYVVSKQKFLRTNTRERNRSIHSAWRDWTIDCCEALPRLFVYVIEGSESADEVERVGDGNLSPLPPRCVTTNGNLMGLIW